tara:strand:- start:2421 stop:3470 length:1050 start_codon:yes stop_codon:yes gene_type:complete
MKFHKIIRSRAPLRLGLAGGGTDIDTYSNKFGGCILNATVSMFAYATIEPRDDSKIILEAIDLGKKFETATSPSLEIDGELSLLKGTYNRVMKDFKRDDLGFKLTTYCDAPPGTGLGSSSTLVVAILGAFTEWLSLPLGHYDIAHLAYQIERKDLAFAGGKQDQYAATFGGFNFMEFHDNDRVVVNPLKIPTKIVRELEMNIILYFLGISRHSSDIIEDQSNSSSKENSDSLEAMHEIKARAVEMKESILVNDLNNFGKIMDLGWASKKKTSNLISNDRIDRIYETALDAGALGGKISGAGGGGFFIFYAPGNSRYKVINDLNSKYGGEFRRFNFTDYGLKKWTIDYQK